MSDPGPRGRKRRTSGPTRRILGSTPREATDELLALYGRTKKLRLSVDTISYANLAFVQVSPRDVLIDFIQAPGHPHGGEVIVSVVRIYLPPPAARSLAEVLGRTIEKVEKAGQFEKPS